MTPGGQLAKFKRFLGSNLFTSVASAVVVAILGVAAQLAITYPQIKEKIDVLDTRVQDLSARLEQSEDARKDAVSLNLELCSVVAKALEARRLTLLEIGSVGLRCGGVPKSPPRVEIIQPIHEKFDLQRFGHVEGRTVVRGRVDRAQLGSKDIWVATQTPGSNRYYIQGFYQARFGPVGIDGNGEWTSPEVVVGNPTKNEAGKHFYIVVLSATSDCSKQFWDYLKNAEDFGSYPGIVELPTGAAVEDRVEVVRD